MVASEFKTEMKSIKDLLIGKTIKVSFINGNNIASFSFDTLKGFGNAILEFEKLGANFGFIKVGNNLIEKPTRDHKELLNRLNNGVWDNIHFLAKTIN
ncbi:hypothetical protein DHD32_01145 [Arenibacter sp. TNZ]|uniref:hypothetical protein n=1 Tax=Arenibacter TaxID=178469 RepID=UPI000CD475A4|nr:MULTISPECIES: hypothetical protein [Arenibacter]MCM4170069.1 hypothetical protein [Arenibacter sp. TNZ]